MNEHEELPRGLEAAASLCAEYRADIKALRAELARVTAEKQVSDADAARNYGEWQAMASERNQAREAEDAARRDAERLREALAGAVEWMNADGCDCGTDEQGTCALCVAHAALATEPPAPEDPLADLVARFSVALLVGRKEARHEDA